MKARLEVQFPLAWVHAREVKEAFEQIMDSQFTYQVQWARQWCLLYQMRLESMDRLVSASCLYRISDSRIHRFRGLTKAPRHPIGLVARQCCQGPAAEILDVLVPEEAIQHLPWCDSCDIRQPYPSG